MKKILFFCLEGVSRSPTAARVFNEMLHNDGLSGEYHASYAGILSEDKPGCKEVEESFRVIAVDGMVANALCKTYPDAKTKLRQLSVPDIYERDCPELVGIFKEYYVSKEWL